MFGHSVLSLPATTLPLIKILVKGPAFIVQVCARIISMTSLNRTSLKGFHCRYHERVNPSEIHFLTFEAVREGPTKSSASTSDFGPMPPSVIALTRWDK